jgi:hypothetical protein
MSVGSLSRTRDRCVSSRKARIKTDVIDATVLAGLYASGFLPEVWIPDEATLGLRRQVARRT